VPDQRAELDVPGVGVRVEVDHRDAALPEVLGHPGGVRPGDRVVAAQHQRDRAVRGDGVDRLLQIAHRALGVAGEQLDVPGVVHGQVALQPVDPEGQRGPGTVVREIAGLADEPRSEPSAGPVRGAAVEGCAQDDDVRVGVGVRLAPVASGHPEEGDVGTEL
jgi:hypothetical protein